MSFVEEVMEMPIVVEYHCENLSCLPYCPGPKKMRGFESLEAMKEYQYDHLNDRPLSENLIFGSCPRFSHFPHVIDKVTINLKGGHP